MKEGQSCHGALSKLNTLLYYPSDRLNFKSLVPLASEKLQEVNVNLDVQEDEEEDPLHKITHFYVYVYVFYITLIYV